MLWPTLRADTEIMLHGLRTLVIKRRSECSCWYNTVGASFQPRARLGPTDRYCTESPFKAITTRSCLPHPLSCSKKGYTTQTIRQCMRMPDQPFTSGFISGGSLLASINSIAAAFMQYLSPAPARMCSSAACHEAQTYK